MKLLARLLAALGIVVVLFVLVAFLLPSRYHVERSIHIEAPAATVFPLLADLRNWKQWGVWYQRDPEMVVTFTEPTAGVGGQSAWRSATQGNGQATLTVVTPPSRVEYELAFEGWDTPSKGIHVLTPEGSGTHVTWEMEGELGNNPLARWFGLFFDRLIGGDFEAGLANLKRVAETPPATGTAAAPAPTP